MISRRSLPAFRAARSSAVAHGSRATWWQGYLTIGDDEIVDR
jgi:hypothetical protein